MKANELYRKQQELINTRRGYMVAKSNDLIQKSRYSMGAQEQNILAVVISAIKPDDEPDKLYSITIKEFCQICNIDYANGTNYEAVKKALKSFADESIWVRKPDGIEVLLRWLDRVEISPNKGTIEYSFHSAMTPYLFGLKKKYTQYQLDYYLPLTSKYAKRLYEYLKSQIDDLGGVSLTIQTLKEKIDATIYERFPDFRRNALEPAVREINTYTDIKVSYELRKKSRAYYYIDFRMSKVEGVEMDIRTYNVYLKMWK